MLSALCASTDFYALPFSLKIFVPCGRRILILIANVALGDRGSDRQGHGTGKLKDDVAKNRTCIFASRKSSAAAGGSALESWTCATFLLTGRQKKFK
jgi:hypothetical protein